jgi:hypothetical protein
MKGPFLPSRIQCNGQEWIWLNGDELNHEKYDERIESRDSWPFMLSWYWDAVCHTWGAYVKGNYEDVFPLCRKWKFGLIPMLVTPYCVKWIEGNKALAEHVISNVMALKNLSFPFDVADSELAIVQILSKNEQWNPSGDLKRNVKKAEKLGYRFNASGDWASFSRLMRKFHPYPWRKGDESTMERLYRRSSDLGYGFISEVKLDDEVVASYFYILWKSRLLFVQNVTHANHKGGSPMALLIYSILEKLSAEKIYPEVHFMGSANAGVAEYNKKFGAIDREYFRLKNY